MKQIPIYNKGVVVDHSLVDDEDFDNYNKFKWYINHNGYAYRQVQIGEDWYDESGKRHRKRKSEFLHILINNTPNGFDTDHINCEKLDNRKENLRTATHKENTRNCKTYKNKTGYKGIYKHSNGKCFVSHITYNWLEVYLGVWRTKEEAALAYNCAARILHGEFANLNEFDMIVGD